MAKAIKRPSPHQKSLAKFDATHLEIHECFAELTEACFKHKSVGKQTQRGKASGRWFVRVQEVAAIKTVLEQMKEPIECLEGGKVNVHFMKCASIHERDETEDINDISENVLMIAVRFNKSISFNTFVAWLGFKKVPTRQQLQERAVVFFEEASPEWFEFFFERSHGFKHVHATTGQFKRFRATSHGHSVRSFKIKRIEENLKELSKPAVFQFKWSAEAIMAMNAQRLEAIKQCLKHFINVVAEETEIELNKFTEANLSMMNSHQC